MTFWNKLHEEHAWGRSLLLKSGVLGIGIVVVLWAGWPQPQIGHLDHPSAPIVLSEDKLIEEVHDNSISVPSISQAISLGSSPERKKSEFQAARLSELVDLNGSSRMELEALPGIGMVLADRIMTYRSIHGAFQQVDDLVNVSGIGEKRLKRLQPFVKVETKEKKS